MYPIWLNIFIYMSHRVPPTFKLVCGRLNGLQFRYIDTYKNFHYTKFASIIIILCQQFNAQNLFIHFVGERIFRVA